MYTKQPLLFWTELKRQFIRLLVGMVVIFLVTHSWFESLFLVSATRI